MAAERNARWPSSCIFPDAWHFKLKIESIKEVEPAAMEQKMLVYSFVAHGTVILAETDVLASNLATIAAKHLQNMPPTQSTFSYSEYGHSFNFLARDGFGMIVPPLPFFLYTFMFSFSHLLCFLLPVYSVVAAESIGREVPFGFLERIQNDFSQRYDRGKVIAPASINREYG